ncbi:MAG: Wzz/FepE/Etk N-terminal domain-containing protein [Turicibacter sanguinis]
MDEAVEMEISLEEIVRMLLKRWWLIVSFVIIGMIGCGVYTHRMLCRCIRRIRRFW